MNAHIASELKAAASCLDAARAHVNTLPLGDSPDLSAQLAALPARVVLEQAPTVAAALLVLAEVLAGEEDEMVGQLWDTSPPQRLQ